MLALPTPPRTPNERALASRTRERFTGLTTATLTLGQSCVAGTELVFKNGALVDPATYTVRGPALTLGSALVSGDVVVVTYQYRTA